MPNLVVCVEGSASDKDLVACRDVFMELESSEWTHQPEFVDQIDAIEMFDPDDLPAVRSVGVLLALPEPAAGTDEQAVRDDVAQLIGAMSELARRSHIEFVIEYREEEVGSLDGSDRDDRFIAAFFGE
jgi:hypothetical protein